MSNFTYRPGVGILKIVDVPTSPKKIKYLKCCHSKKLRYIKKSNK